MVPIVFSFFQYSCVIDQSLLIIMAGTGLLGVMAGTLGAFTFLRHQGMLGDAIAHAALPGTVLAFLLTHSKNASVLCCGGMLSALVGVLLVELIASYTLLKRDVAIGIVLTLFFGSGLVLLSVAQRYPLYGHALLNRLLFGNAAMMTSTDLTVIAVATGILLGIVWLLWNAILLVIFDQHQAFLLGYRPALINGILMICIVGVVALGLQTTGGILMSTLLLAPATAARQWTDMFASFVLLSGFLGMLAAVSGSFISALAVQLPTGPIIVVVSGLFLLFSFICGPKGLMRTS